MKKLMINVGIMGLVCLLLALGTLYWLKIYTNHNAELITVPNLEGELSQAAIRKLDALELEGLVADTVYKDGVKKLSVINQNPVPGSKVKPGRKIYLVINTKDVPLVAVPNMANRTSLDQAKNLLIRSHLKLGKVTNVMMSSVQGEPVLEQNDPRTGKPIAPGSLIERNSEIDLVVGVARNQRDTSAVQTPPDVPEDNP